MEDRAILLIDTSASMQTTDMTGGRTRLAAAKEEAAKVIDRLKPRDVAMIISFSDRARVRQPFTSDRRLLRRRLQSIEATQHTSDISEATSICGRIGQSGAQWRSRGGRRARSRSTPG